MSEPPDPAPRWIGGAAVEMTADELAALEASWPSCDYWSLGSDTERLTHRTVLDALELDELRDAEHAIGWFLQFRDGGLTVHGYTRKTVTAKDVDSMVERLTEAFLEHWTESLEFGDPEEDYDDEPEWLRAAVTADMRKRHVWQCDHTVSLTLSAAAVAAMVLRERPGLVRPPLGVVPRSVWQEMVPDPSRWEVTERARLLREAIERFAEVGREPKDEWRDELAEHTAALAGRP